MKEYNHPYFDQEADWLEDDLTYEWSPTDASLEMREYAQKFGDCEGQEEVNAVLADFGHFYQETLLPLLESGDFDPSEVEQYVVSAEELESVSPLRLFKTLSFIPKDVLQDLYDENPTYLDAMMSRAVEGIELAPGIAEPAATLEGVERIVADHYGDRFAWRKRGQVVEDLPEAVASLAANTDFPRYIVRATPEEAGPQETKVQQRARFQAVERSLLRDVLGVPSHIARESRMAFATRTLERDENGLVPSRARVDIISWRKTLDAYVRNASQVSPEQMNALYETFNLVNYDRLSPEQMATQVGVVESPAVRDRLKKTDVTFVVADRYDANGGMTNLAGRLREPESAIVFEVASPTSLYKPVINFVKKTGIVPSRIAGVVHGLPGVLTFGEGTEQFFIAADYDKSNTSPVPIHAIEDSRIGDFLERFMKPHSETGRREVVLISCSQALGRSAVAMSTAEAIVAVSHPQSNVHVIAPPMPVSFALEDGKTRFYQNLDRGGRSVVSAIAHSVGSVKDGRVESVLKTPYDGTIV